MIEAAWVLFREGLESLLMVSRAKDKRRWLGFMLAVACSVLIGVAINVVLGSLLDSFRGIVALTAAAFIGYILTKEDRGGLAFFAVFREGMETVLFYTAIIRTTSITQLLMGALLGAVGVAIAAILIFKYGIRSSKFMWASSVVLWWLAIKFVGVGITELELGRTSLAWWPSIAWLGLFPSLEAIVAQVVFVGGACVLKWKGRVPASQDKTALA